MEVVIPMTTANNEKKHTSHLATGVGVGVVLGVALGLSITQLGLPLGIALGIILGAAAGWFYDQQEKKKRGAA